MPLLRRLIATVSGTFFLQLSLLGSVAPCTMDGGHDPNRPVQAHSMNGAHSDGGCSARNTSKSCRLPCAPETQGTCASMASCATATAAPPAEIRILPGLVSAGDLPEPLSIESDLTTAPDSPPPRV